MRRYQMALATTMAVVFGVGFLYYKHEYDRLYHLLHVLDTFGNEHAKISSLIKDGEPSYQGTANVIISSAYWDDRSQIPNVLLTGLSFFDSRKKLKCWLWFESDNVKARESLLRVQYISNVVNMKHTREAALFKCFVSFSDGSPYGAYIGPELPAVAKPIYVDIPPKLTKSQQELAVCIFPLSGPYSDIYLLEKFIDYYKHFGVTHFLFHDGGIAPKVHQFFKKQDEELVEVRSWNADMSNHRHHIMFMQDCFLKHLQYKHIIILSVNQYIQLHHSENITSLLDRTNSAGLFIMSKIFCTEHPFNTHDLNLQKTLLDQTYDSVVSKSVLVLQPRYVERLENGNGSDPFEVQIISRPEYSSFSTEVLNPDVSVVHEIKYCKKLL